MIWARTQVAFPLVSLLIFTKVSGGGGFGSAWPGMRTVRLSFETTGMSQGSFFRIFRIVRADLDRVWLHLLEDVSDKVLDIGIVLV